jgi:hypothetical protein
MLVIKLTCDRGHEQIVRLHHANRDAAEFMAKVLEGTAAQIMYSPLEDSLARCGLCYGNVKVTVEEGAVPATEETTA